MRAALAASIGLDKWQLRAVSAATSLGHGQGCCTAFDVGCEPNLTEFCGAANVGCQLSFLGQWRWKDMKVRSVFGTSML